ncbi:MAG: transporter [Pseudomonadota bacterium]
MRAWPLILLLVAAPAAAQDERDLCPDRPGLGTPACTTAPGRMMLEVGLADWTLDRTSTNRTDTLVAGDTLVRIGVARSAEVQIGWTGFGRIRDRDRLGGVTDTTSGTGDLTVAVRRNLANPDGSGTSIAVMPYLTLPTGGAAIGAGDWSAGLLVPISFDLGRGLSLGLTPQIDAAADEDSHGRHLAYGSVIGLGIGLTDSVSATAEVQVTRDRDPATRTTQALAGLSLGWEPGHSTQIDVGTNIGLNRMSSDVALYLGIARRF